MIHYRNESDGLLSGISRIIISTLLLLIYVGIGYGLDIPDYRVKKVQLENGFRVLLKSDPGSSMVAIGLLVGAGIRTEESLLGSGISHLVEHLVFQGTHQTKSSDIAKKIESYGGDINAFTTPDFTIYYVEIPKQFAMVAVDVLSEAILSPAFREEDIEKEKDVVSHEMNMGKDNPSRMLTQILWQSAFLVHPYRVKTIGSEELLKALSKRDIDDYYKKWYVPDNMTLIIAGNFDEESFLPGVKERLIKFPRKPFSSVVVPAEPVRSFLKQNIQTGSGHLTRVMVGYNIPSLNHVDFIPLDLLSIILGDGKDSRLYRLLREKLRLVYAIDSWTVGLFDAGMLGVSATLLDSTPEPVLDALSTEIDAVKKGSITQKELDRAKRREVMAYIKTLDSLSGQVWWIGSMYYITGNPSFINEYLRRIEMTTLKDIQRVARKYLKGQSICVLGPELPEDIEKILDAHEETVQSFILPNGLQVLIGSDRRIPLVEIKLFFLGGLSAEEDATNGVFNLLTKMLVQNEKIVSFIESLGGDISGYVGYNTFGFSIRILPDDVKVVLEELSTLLKQPGFTQDSLEKEKKGALAAIKNIDDSPIRWAGWEMRKQIFKNHPYRFLAEGSIETLKGFALEDLSKTLAHYAVGKNGVLAIFGDVDPVEMLPWVTSFFNTMDPGLYKPFPLQAEQERIDQPAAPLLHIQDSPDTLENIVFEKAVHRSRKQVQSIVLVGYRGLRITDDDRYIIDVIASMLSGFGSPLFETIRNELGAVYFIGAYHLFGLDPGAFIVYAGTTPENEETIVKFINKTVYHLCVSPVDEDLLTWAKQKYIGEQLRVRERLGSKAELMGLSLLYQIKYDDDQTFREKIEKISGDDIMRVAKKYLDPALSTELIVSPAKSMKEE